MSYPWRLYFYDPGMRGEVGEEYTYFSVYKSPVRMPVTLGDVKISREQGTKIYYTLDGGAKSVRGAISQPKFEFPDLFFTDMQELEFFLNMCFNSNKVLILYHGGKDPWFPDERTVYPVVAESSFDVVLVSTPDQVAKPRYRVKTPTFVAVTSLVYPRPNSATFLTDAQIEEG